MCKFRLNRCAHGAVDSTRSCCHCPNVVVFFPFDVRAQRFVHRLAFVDPAKNIAGTEAGVVLQPSKDSRDSLDRSCRPLTPHFTNSRGHPNMGPAA